MWTEKALAGSASTVSRKFNLLVVLTISFG
jgi:hypothetical protein